jgi:hypothetical protein
MLAAPGGGGGGGHRMIIIVATQFCFILAISDFEFQQRCADLINSN